MASLEARNLRRLQGEAPREPLLTKAGDIWHLKDKSNQLEYVMLVLGYKKRGRHRQDGHTHVYMYHWGHPSLLARPCDLRDNDGNASAAEAVLLHNIERGNRVRFIGNLFELLPLSELLT